MCVGSDTGAGEGVGDAKTLIYYKEIHRFKL